MKRPAFDPLARLARLTLRRPRLTLLAALCLVLLAGVAGAGVTEQLHHGGTAVEDAESARADETLSRDFHGGSPSVALVATTSGSVDAPDAARAGAELVARARTFPHVVAVHGYWPGRDAALRGRGGHAAVVHVRVTASESEAHERVQPLLDALTGRHGPLQVRATGPSPVRLAIEEQTRDDLVHTELLEAPLVAAVLVVVFGGVVTAGLALMVGLCAMVGAAALLRALNGFTDVSLIALNLATALGFALAVDFSLFLLARYREERARTPDPAAALEATVRRTGRTVTVSALTVIGSLAALLVFPVDMLRSVAYGGIAVVAASAVLALTALPAAVLLLGDRIDALSFRRRRTPRSPGDGRWYRLAHRVMARPVPVVLVLGSLLAVLVLPFGSARFGSFDDRALPGDSPVRQATDTLRSDFDYQALHPVQVALPGLDAERDGPELGRYARKMSRIEHVRRVETATGVYRDGQRVAGPPAGHASPAGVWAAVVTDVGPESTEGTRVVRDVRALPSPAPVLVGGTQAWLVDLQDTLRDRLAPALALIAALTLALLGWSTRSLLLPVKALVLNTVSLTATFGVMVFVFQEGHLHRWLGFTPTGVTDTLQPVLVLCVAFGLSMDYEVLLLSRTVEEHARGAPTRQAVALAVQRTAGLFTASALIVVVVMAALATSGLMVLKVVGVGVAMAVLIDATVIRLLLAPALMAVTGRANWWLPRLPRTPRLLRRSRSTLPRPRGARGSAEPGPEPRERDPAGR
ncbi:MMPL family transporter [Streptomyces cacaoi]|uniref:Membrane protein n=3 Tax=Streptomyces cacaoi TaxID=1898 RepID=A0A4Y3R354_STRCI|nr:MMPL family transporter [Streptomyces cacaoi]NNG89843.1 MMPL family transporter [Streptomyces cacaoi]GEB52031.1 membrane protein [Streptomyces cacaoi]